MFKPLFILSAALFLGACQHSSDTNPIDNISTAAKDRDLQQKNFAAPCAAKPLPGLTSSQIVYRFDGANATRTTRYYKTPDCSGDSDITFMENGAFDLNTNDRSNDGGKAIDIDYKTVIVTTVTAEGVTAANALVLCGANDWTQKAQRDESAHASAVNCLGAEIPRHDANRYRVDANV